MTVALKPRRVWCNVVCCDWCAGCVLQLSLCQPSNWVPQMLMRAHRRCSRCRAQLGDLVGQRIVALRQLRVALRQRVQGLLRRRPLGLCSNMLYLTYMP